MNFGHIFIGIFGTVNNPSARAIPKCIYIGLFFVHLNILFSTVPPTFRANVAALALVVNLRQAWDSIPPI